MTASGSNALAIAADPAQRCVGSALFVERFGRSQEHWRLKPRLNGPACCARSATKPAQAGFSQNARHDISR